MIDVVSSDAWPQSGINRCLNALKSCSTAPDKLGLIRELARFHDGVVNLDQIPTDLDNRDREIASEFGLEITPSAIRTNDWLFDGKKAQILKNFNLDTSYRRVYETADADACLIKYSQHRSYKCYSQKSSIRALQTMPVRSNLMVSMPTGTGKSLLFQMAPFLWGRDSEAACVLVIVPTVALALDHKRTLSQIPGLENSKALTGDIGSGQRTEILNSFRRGEVPILLMSPEMALMGARENLLEAATSIEEKGPGLKARMTALIVDEAHIIDSWGRTFRPEFQRLPGLVSELRRKNPELRTVLLSATLSRGAKKRLHEIDSEGEWLEIHANVPRYEFDITSLSYSDREYRDNDLFFSIRCAPRPLIVYTTLVEEAQSIYGRLKEYGFSRLAIFTGRISDTEERKDIVERWARDEIDIVVATSAFGMGVDKSDVRTVIHACLPEGPDRYYQEIGRAARDGFQGHALCLWTDDNFKDDGDVKVANRLCTQGWLSPDLIIKRWKTLLDRSIEMGGLSYQGAKRIALLDLNAWHGHPKGYDSDYNRIWNMSLINLLQRTGALHVRSVISGDHEFRETWEVEIVVLDLLSPNPENPLWSEVFLLRDQEQRDSKERLDAFLKVFRRKRPGCLLRGIYDLVDPYDPLRGRSQFVADCGRCASCEEKQKSPPSLVYSSGMEKVWRPRDTENHANLSFDISAFEYSDYRLNEVIEQIIMDLAHIGVEQFILPNDFASMAADVSLNGGAKRGFVLNSSMLVEKKNIKISSVKTAFVFDDNSQLGAFLWNAIQSYGAVLPRESMVVIFPSSLILNNRRFRDIVSRTGPYHVSQISNLYGHPRLN